MFQTDDFSRILDSVIRADLAAGRATAGPSFSASELPWGALPDTWKWVGLVALAVYVFSAFATAMIAENKGRSGAGWFALALLIGPLAVAFSMIAMPAAAERALVSLGTRRDAGVLR